MNLFDYIFGNKKPIFDQLIDLLGESTFKFWNGTNYGPEVMFKQTVGPVNGCDPTCTDRVYYSFANPPPFCKIYLGRTNSCYHECLIELYIHQNTEIVWCCPDLYGSTGDPRTDKHARKLLKKLNRQKFLDTNHSIFRRMISMFFEARPESRIKHCIELKSLDEREIDLLRGHLAQYEEEYVKHDATIEVAYTKVTPHIRIGEFTGLDNAEFAIKYGSIMKDHPDWSHELSDYSFGVIK